VLERVLFHLFILSGDKLVTSHQHFMLFSHINGVQLFLLVRLMLVRHFYHDVLCRWGCVPKKHICVSSLLSCLFLQYIVFICLFIVWFSCDYLYNTSCRSFHWFSAVVRGHKPFSVHMLDREGGITSEW